MLQAMSTGDGSLCTIHARSAGKAFDRIVTLCLEHGAGMTDGFAYRLAAGAIDLVVHVALLDESLIGGRKHRFVAEVLEVDGIGEAVPAGADPGVRARPGRPRRAGAPAAVPARAGPGRVRPGLAGRPRRHLDRPAAPGRGCAVTPTTVLAAVAGAMVAAGMVLVVVGLIPTTAPARVREPQDPHRPARGVGAVAVGPRGRGRAARLDPDRLAGRRPGGRRRGARAAGAAGHRGAGGPRHRPGGGGGGLDPPAGRRAGAGRRPGAGGHRVGAHRPGPDQGRGGGPWRRGWPPAGPPRPRCAASPTPWPTRPGTWWSPR